MTSDLSEVVFSSIHYTITFIFFIVILVNVISLTLSTINMSVSSSDTNAVTAKNLMIAAQAIAYFGLGSILLFVGFAYFYSGKEENKEYYDLAMTYTGSSDIYIMMRVIVFSILMFISIVVSALCLAAAKQIDLSDDPSQYTSQYNLCKELGVMFFLHFAIFSIIQGGSYMAKIFYSTNNIKIKPEQKTTVKNFQKQTKSVYQSNFTSDILLSLTMF